MCALHFTPVLVTIPVCAFWTRQALQARDIRGHTPLSYAALRFGSDSTVLASLLRLAATAGTSVDMEELSALGRVHRMPPRIPPRGGEGSRTAGVVREGSGGGWSEVPLQDEVLRGDVDRCDILEVSGRGGLC